MTVRCAMSTAGLAMLLALAGCGAADATNVAALDGTWTPVELLGRDYSDFAPVNGETTITLAPSRKEWSGHDGCNEVYGSVEADVGGEFRAVAERTTDVGCDLSPGQELPNVLVVEQATRWRLDDGRLVLEAGNGSVLGVYRR